MYLNVVIFAEIFKEFFATVIQYKKYYMKYSLTHSLVASKLILIFPVPFFSDLLYQPSSCAKHFLLFLALD